MFQFNLLSLLQILYGVQCVFGALLLQGKAGFRFLRIKLLCIAVLMVFNLLEEAGLTRNIHMITPAFSLVFGPLFWLFVRDLFGAEALNTRALFFHFLPALISLAFTHHVQFVLALGALSQVAYGVLIFRLVQQFRRANQALVAEQEAESMRWLIQVFFCFAALALVDMTRLTLQPHLALHILLPWYALMLAAYYLLISWLIFKAARQPLLFTRLRDFRDLHNQRVHDESDEYARTIFESVDKLVLDESLFARERLQLRHLAEKLGVHEREVSRAINLCSGKNFADYVNYYRLKHAKAFLQQSELSILDAALASGFSSKSTFNAVFKRVEGCTPSEYRKRSAKS